MAFEPLSCYGLSMMIEPISSSDALEFVALPFLTSCSGSLTSNIVLGRRATPSTCTTCAQLCGRSCSPAVVLRTGNAKSRDVRARLADGKRETAHCGATAARPFGRARWIRGCADVSAGQLAFPTTLLIGYRSSVCL